MDFSYVPYAHQNMRNIQIYQYFNFYGLDGNHKNHKNLLPSKIPCLTVVNKCLIVTWCGHMRLAATVAHGYYMRGVHLKKKFKYTENLE